MRAGDLTSSCNTAPCFPKTPPSVSKSVPGSVGALVPKVNSSQSLYTWKYPVNGLFKIPAVTFTPKMAPDLGFFNKNNYYSQPGSLTRRKAVSGKELWGESSGWRKYSENFSHPPLLLLNLLPAGYFNTLQHSTVIMCSGKHPGKETLG